MHVAHNLHGVNFVYHSWSNKNLEILVVEKGWKPDSLAKTSHAEQGQEQKKTQPVSSRIQI